jgi:hypothetical protein
MNLALRIADALEQIVAALKELNETFKKIEERLRK